MAKTQLNDLQITRMKRTTEMIDTNYLGEALLTQPEIANTIAYIFGDRYPISYLTQGSGRVSEKYDIKSNSEYEWPLYGNFFKTIPIKATVGSHPKPGVGFSPFQLVLGEKYFQEGETVRFPVSGLVARVQDEPVQTGALEWTYSFVLVSNDPAAFVPSADFAAGKRLALQGNKYEEASEGGPSKTAAPMRLRNQMGISRWQWSMTGSAQTEAIVLKMKDKFLWTPVMEWQQMLMWAELTERMRWYDPYNKTANGEIFLKGKNGRVVRSGGGIFSQIAGANKREYTFLSEEFLSDWLMDLTLNHKDAENKKLFLFTGAGGMKEFHRALKKALDSATIVDTTMIHKRADGKLGFGSYFTTYKGLLGQELTVVHVPMFNDKTFFPELHPTTKLPIESYRMVALDFSDYGGEPNISLVAKGADGINRSMVQWYTAGGAAPDFANRVGAGKVMRSHGKDAYDVHTLSESGTKIINPLACGELRMNPSIAA
jgi:hypothetical protein